MLCMCRRVDEEAHLAPQHVAQPQLLGGDGEGAPHAITQEDRARARAYHHTAVDAVVDLHLQP